MIRSKKVVVVAVSLLLLGGCGSSPTEADARRCLGARIAKVSEGRIKLVSLRKTNGRDIRGAGSPDGYELDYEAEIEFTEDCYWSPNYPLGSAFETVSAAMKAKLDRLNNPEAKMSSEEYWKLREISSMPEYNRPLELARKGQRVRHTGKVQFSKTERGWEG